MTINLFKLTTEESVRKQAQGDDNAFFRQLAMLKEQRRSRLMQSQPSETKNLEDSQTQLKKANALNSNPGVFGGTFLGCEILEVEIEPKIALKQKAPTQMQNGFTPSWLQKKDMYQETDLGFVEPQISLMPQFMINYQSPEWHPYPQP